MTTRLVNLPMSLLTIARTVSDLFTARTFGKVVREWRRLVAIGTASNALKELGGNWQAINQDNGSLFLCIWYIIERT